MANNFYIAHRFLCRLALCLIFAQLLFIAELPAQENELSFRHFTTRDGLSENSVICIFQDSKGFMWFGTGDGLNRYDGYEFKIFKNDPDDPGSIGSSYILFVFEDRQNRLWIGTWNGGLNRYDRDRQRFIRYEHDPADAASLSDNSALCMFQDRRDALWIGTIRGGLNRFDPEAETFVSYRHDPENSNSLSHNVVTRVCQDTVTSGDDLWIATGGGGLNRFNPETGTFTYYRHNPDDPHSLSNDQVTVVLPDPQKSGILWIGTRGGGICQFDIRSEKFTTFRHDPENPNSLRNDLIYALFIDREENLWVGTFGGGLNRLNPDGHTFNHYTNQTANPNSLSDNKVISIQQDHSGNLWFGTHKVGINKLNRLALRFRNYSHQPDNPQSLCSSFITAVYEDHDKILWIGTQEGLTRYNPANNNYRHYFHRSGNVRSLGNNWVSEIYEDSQGQLWFGTYGGGLNLMQQRSGHFKRFCPTGRHPDDFCDDQVLSIIESDGYLWLGIRNVGISKMDPADDSFHLFEANPSDPNQLSDPIVRQIYPDREGMLWVATNDGLNRFDPQSERVRRYFHKPEDRNSLSDNRILSIYEDQKGILWIGTLNGLNRFDRKANTFTRYTESDGLPNNVIYATVEDADGNLWISTNHGLSKFDSHREKFTNFDASDGLQINEFNLGAHFRSARGEMFFGGYNGLIAFFPDSITKNPYPPPVVLTDFQILNKSVPQGENSPLPKSVIENPEIRLSYHDKVFSFEFAALDFTAPNKNQYAYMMEGFDKDWVYSGSRRFATYTNLDPGEYIFRVKGANNSGVWNEEETAIRIVITPPYWMTWWFRLLAILAVAALLYAFYRMRLNRLLEVERTRTRIARDLHDEVSASLSSITFLGQAIRNRFKKELPPDSKKFLNSIVNSASETQEKIKDIIWSINPEHDRWEQLLAKCQRFASDLFDSKGIAYSINIPAPESSRPVSMEQRQHFWLIFKEIATNAARHSQARQIDIEISIEGKNITLIVADEGRGFDPQSVSSGNGLQNIRSRAEKLNARLELHTAPGEGTRWVLEVSS